MFKYSFVALILTGLFSCQSNNQNNTDDISSEKTVQAVDKEPPGHHAKLIVPGHGIGAVLINQSIDNTQKQLGTPDQTNSARGKSVITWVVKADSGKYQTQVYAEKQLGMNDDSSRVKQIRTTSPLYATEKNVKVGATLKKIESSYQVVKAVSYMDNGKQFFIYDDPGDGIAFEIDSNQNCIGIIVHEYGAKLIVRRRFAFHPNTQYLQ